MSTATKQRDLPAGRQAEKSDDAVMEAQAEFDRLMAQSVKSVKYTPFAEQEQIELTFGHVKSFISPKTKKGLSATDADIVKFMMLCKARGLNPWVGDAYLVGYDASDGPQFSLITAIQALFKRAEANPAFDGIQSGVIIRDKDGKITEREGDFRTEHETLLGSWAKVYRKNLSVPVYDSLKLTTYDKGMSQWNKDKEGMIVKCAEASVLRKAFPSQLSEMYIDQEFGAMAAGELPKPNNKPAPRTLTDLASTLAEKPNAALVEYTQESEPVDPLAGFRDALRNSANEAQARDAYERHGNPESSTWTAEDDAKASVLLSTRIAELKGKA